MTEEEKEGIEYIKAFQKDLYGASEKNLMAIYIDRIWDYIDRLQKIIKKQSYTNKKLSNKIKTVRKERNKLQKENEVFKLDMKQIKIILLDFIPHSSRELELKVKLLKLL